MFCKLKSIVVFVRLISIYIFYFIIGSVATEEYERERGSSCNQLCGAFVNTSHVFCAAFRKEIYGASSLVFWLLFSFIWWIFTISIANNFFLSVFYSSLQGIFCNGRQCQRPGPDSAIVNLLNTMHEQIMVSNQLLSGLVDKDQRLYSRKRKMSISDSDDNNIISSRSGKKGKSLCKESETLSVAPHRRQTSLFIIIYYYY